MESLLLSIDYRDPIWIAVAFFFGFLAWEIGLPPLVGFLAAGFALNAMGAEGGEFLGEMADLGVTILLFTIGLKLRVGQLLRPEIWAVSTVHMCVTIVGVAAFLLSLGSFNVLFLDALNPTTALLLGFALSFSSTVFAVKVLEDKGELGSFYGRVAVGVLIVQDIVAVVFLAATSAKLPSPWAVLVIVGLFLARPLLLRTLRRAGHGELLILLGLVLALGGATLFELVKLKGDLGALVLGAMLAGDSRADELAKSLVSFKDLFLLGFFLSIGMTGLPDFDVFLISLLLLTLVPVKVGLFFWLFSRFRMRARPSALASLSLANYSEFGLIVATIAVANGWLDQTWLVVMAVTLALSFVLAAPLNARSDRLYLRFGSRLRRFERAQRLIGDEPIQLSGVRVAVFGMGRLGTGAYRAMRRHFGDAVIGFDFDEQVAAQHRAAERHVVVGDPASPEFWSRVQKSDSEIEFALLCMSSHQANLRAVKLMREWGYTGRIAATAEHTDEVHDLRTAGAEAAFDIYAEAGAGFASHLEVVFGIEGK